MGGDQMSTTDTKQDNIIFIDGKEKGLKILFSQEHFGFLAVGYHSNTGDTNGFVNVKDNDELSQNGFQEISVEEDSTYTRVPLVINQDSIKNYDNGEVTIICTAEFDIDNIIKDMPINQLAIVDSQTPNDPSTIFYAAATCREPFNKSEQNALVIVCELTI